MERAQWSVPLGYYLLEVRTRRKIAEDLENDPALSEVDLEEDETRPFSRRSTIVDLNRTRPLLVSQE
jgi:hypothetical protein